MVMLFNVNDDGSGLFDLVFDANQTVIRFDAAMLFDLGSAFNELETVAFIHVASADKALQIKIGVGINNKPSAFCGVSSVHSHFNLDAGRVEVFDENVVFRTERQRDDVFVLTENLSVHF
jgi:hypothetical protein